MKFKAVLPTTKVKITIQCKQTLKNITWKKEERKHLQKIQFDPEEYEKSLQAEQSQQEHRRTDRPHEPIGHLVEVHS